MKGKLVLSSNLRMRCYLCMSRKRLEIGGIRIGALSKGMAKSKEGAGSMHPLLV